MVSRVAGKRPFWRLKRFWIFLLLGLSMICISSCAGVRILMQTAPNVPKKSEASPSLSGFSLKAWEAQKSDLKQLFGEHVYGKIPHTLSLKLTEQTHLEGMFFHNTASIETRKYKVYKTNLDTGREFGLIIIKPAHLQSPVPIIISQNFCPNHNVIAVDEIPIPHTNYLDCAEDSLASNVFKYFFGRYIVSPPVSKIMQRGYALAAVHPSEFIPDRSEAAQPLLKSIFSEQPDEYRTATLGAWAAQFSLLSDEFENDPNFSDQITYGHSRYGKTALIAAAFNSNIDAVIAHQSGTGGASLSREKPGETIKDITEGYPHWFSQKFSSYADNEHILPVDQHQLLALIAPRPILLGNAKRDVWSDPNGAFQALQSASDIYRLYGSEGLTASRLDQFDPKATLSFWMRAGTHGVVKEDWPAFLDFLDANFKHSN